MADPRRTTRRPFAGSLPRPAALVPRLLTKTFAVVTQHAGRRRAAGTAAVCATAAERRPRSDWQGSSGSGVPGRTRHRDTFPGVADPRERAHEAVASRTTGPADLASLLAMLDLRPRPNGKRPRPKSD